MIFNMVGGGGGSGATLVVSSPANVSVTVSKDDKSYTKNSGSLGSATFKGLATGTWTVTISGNGQTATKTIGIAADYAITIAFFSASINITYPATSTCVVTNSSGQTVASDTNTGSSTKTWTATVNATGTYTITATSTTDSSKTKSATVSITTDGQSETIILSYTLVLYNAGYDNVSVTGGWESKRGCALTKNSDNLYAVATVMYSANTGIFATKNKIDLSQYKTLRYKGKNVANLEGYFGIVISASIPAMGTDPSPSSAAWVNFGAGELAESSIDISSLTGTYYVGCHVLKGETATGSGYLYFMELVP